MFSFFQRKKTLPFPFERLGTDMHSHLLPALDDGAPDSDVSFQLLQGMLELGYCTLITTPHVMEDVYPNTRDTITRACQSIHSKIATQHPTPVLRAAAEYMLDGNFDSLLEQPDQLLPIKDKLLLVEISFVSPPLHLKDLLFRIQMKGFQPVLAHPERYTFFHRYPKEFNDLKAGGCIMQSNLLSFAGYYGNSVREAAHYLAEKGLIDLLGTDLHHDRHLQALRHLPLTRQLQQVLDQPGLLNPSL